MTRVTPPTRRETGAGAPTLTATGVPGAGTTFADRVAPPAKREAGAGAPKWTATEVRDGTTFVERVTPPARREASAGAPKSTAMKMPEAGTTSAEHARGRCESARQQHLNRAREFPRLAKARARCGDSSTENQESPLPQRERCQRCRSGSPAEGTTDECPARTPQVEGCALRDAR